MKFKIYISVILIIALISCSRNFETLAKDDNKYNLTTVSQLADSSYVKQIEDFYRTAVSGFFPGKENIKIHYRIYEQENLEKAILISSGRTEAAIKYKELIFDLFKNGYSIYIYDHRGQGMSGRMLENRDMGYVADFDNYVDDMKIFYDKFVSPRSYQKKYLISHSMGGTIAVSYLQQYPRDFDATSFISPMFGFTFFTCTLVDLLKSEEVGFALGQSNHKRSKSDFEGNNLTNSKIRYERFVDAFSAEPKGKLGGATYTWLNESCDQFDYVFNNINKLKTPLILFSAEHESIVSTYSHRKFIKKVAENSLTNFAYEVSDSQHEILIEKDQARIATLNKTLDFFLKY